MSEKRRRRKSKPTFENGGFWEHYLDLERQLAIFLEYVPYIDKNEGVCSFRLTNTLLNVGGHIDSAFKAMAQYKRFSRDRKCTEIKRKVREARRKMRDNEFARGPGIKLCLEAFENIYRLSEQVVVFKRLQGRDRILPFKPFNHETGAPYWWDIYNQTKHDFQERFEKVTLRVTRDALAGAFLLNVVHHPTILRLNDFGLLKWPPQQIEGEFADLYEHALIRMPTYVLEEMLEKGQNPWGFVDTSLFIYDYSQDGENNYE